MFKRAAVFFALVCGLSAATENPVFHFKHLVLADTDTKVLATNVDLEKGGVVTVANLPLFEGRDFESTIEPFVGQPIGTTLLNKIGAEIEKYARNHDRLITKVLVPTQNVADGTLRLVVVIGRFKDVAVRGNHWFSSKLIEERLGVKPGDEVRLSVLENAVNWANTNPFRRVKVLINPIANQPGAADLIVGVEESAPWRFSTSLDNYGNSILGEWHYAAAVQAGNLWGLDHQASYQFVTTDDIQLYQAHAASYRIPLRWRHFIDASISYVRVNALIQNAIAQTGRNVGADLKYTIPIRSGDDPIEVHAGLDFKRGNNYFEFAGQTYLPTNVDTFQFTPGGSMLKHDKFGATAVALELNFSPGGIDAHNHTHTYHEARPFSNPQYFYANLSLQRLTELGKGWELLNRFTGQLASTNLQGSEQLTAGGPTSVRGFGTNSLAADEGIIFNTDLQTPPIGVRLDKLKIKGKPLPPLIMRFAAFYDIADLRRKHPIIEDFPLTTLSSAGVGIRMNIANNFSLNFDYGWQLQRLHPFYHDTEHGHGHVKVVLAF